MEDKKLQAQERLTKYYLGIKDLMKQSQGVAQANELSEEDKKKEEDVQD